MLQRGARVVLEATKHVLRLVLQGVDRCFNVLPSCSIGSASFHLHGEKNVSPCFVFTQVVSRQVPNT
jgi:hypothetical protein